MIVEIEGRQVERIEYKDHPVITLRMIDELHERPEGTAKNSFHRYEDKLIENEDFFRVPYKEWSKILSVQNMYRSKTALIFLTESGYLMIVKPFGDDLAWKVQRALVRNYFAAREMLRGASSVYDPEIKAFLKETVALLGSFRKELASIRNGLERSRDIDRELPYLMQQAVHLISEVREELAQTRKERDLFRDRLFILQDHIEKGTSDPEASEITCSYTSAESSETRSGDEHAHEHETLKDFIAVWWRTFGNDRVGVSHLYPLIKEHSIPLNLVGGTDRSRSICLGRKLTAICGQRFGDCIVTEAKKWRNVKRYSLCRVIGEG